MAAGSVHAGADLPTVTDREAEQLRAETDTVVVATTTSNYYGRLHLPDAETAEHPRCDDLTAAEQRETDWQEKDIAVYPPGHMPWCRFCAALWRRAGGAD